MNDLATAPAARPGVRPHTVRASGPHGSSVTTIEPHRSPTRIITWNSGTADLARREVQHADGERFMLSRREAELLAFLAQRAGRTVSRDELLLGVWGFNPQRVVTRTVDMHIANLRGKLREDAARPTLLHTVRGQGYAFGPGRS